MQQGPRGGGLLPGGVCGCHAGKQTGRTAQGRAGGGGVTGASIGGHHTLRFRRLRCTVVPRQDRAGAVPESADAPVVHLAKRGARVGQRTTHLVWGDTGAGQVLPRAVVNALAG